MSAMKAAAAAALGIALALGGGTAALAVHSSTPDPQPSLNDAPTLSQSESVAESVTGGAQYPGNPKSEALLTDTENQRLIELRAIVNEADVTRAQDAGPYRLATGRTYTLVLTARKAAYTFDDLIRLEPSTLVRQPGGAYLLGENIVVEAGAVLKIDRSDGLTLRMQSDSQSFVSIITLGGALAFGGSAAHPVRVTSWDPTTGKVDTDTTDGRAYIRIIGGNADFSYAKFDHLGFWSGVTGGVSLTGTQAATTGSATDARPAKGGATVFGKQLLPAGAAGTVDIQPNLTGYSYVSARVINTTFSDDAFGLFVSSAQGVAVSHVTVTRSLVDGIVFHRNVVDSTITNSSSTDNGRDGVILTRATSGVDLDNVTANRNQRNGITIEGGALADGPSATGVSTAVYGNNGVTNSTANSNVHYGIAVIGGTNMRVTGNTASNQVSGIVVSGGATGTTIKNNLVQSSSKQGIVLRDAGTTSIVEGNTIDTAAIAIYLRNADATIQHNTIENTTSHAITLVGATGASLIRQNTASGVGYSAIDVSRSAHAVTVGTNDIEHWRDTKPFQVVLRGIFQPLTIMWVVIGLAILATAAHGARRRSQGIRHPYANLAPLSTFTKGTATPEEARASRGLRTAA